MSALAVRTGAINLGQGFPDTDGPTEVLDAAVDAIRGGVNQYPPGPGMPVLRQAIAEHQRRFYGLDYDPDTEVLVTAGATEALAGALLGMLDDGRRGGAVRADVRQLSGLHRARRRRAEAGRAASRPRCRWPLRVRPRRVPGGGDRPHQADPAQHAPQPDRQGVHPRRAGADRRRGPASTTCSSSPTRSTSTWCSPGPSTSRWRTLPGMAERTLTISSGGKTFNTTGWKIGWMCGPAAMVDAAKTAKQFLTYVNGAPFQPAIGGRAAAARHVLRRARRRPRGQA